MFLKLILTLTLVYAVTITATFARDVKPNYPSCDAKCKENWITESLVSRIREYQVATSGHYDGKKINLALENALVRIRTELVNKIVPASNGVGFFPILALINLLIFIVILLIDIYGGGARAANPAEFELATLDDWYVDSYNKLQQFYYSAPRELSDFIFDHVETAKCILQDLYYSLGGEHIGN